MANTRKRRPFPGVYYITHRDNLPSIIKHGVLSHANAEKLPDIKTIYDSDVVNRRGNKRAPDGKTLWDFANFYFQPRNPMLYRVFRCDANPVVILHLKETLCKNAKYVAIGNAASSASEIVDADIGLARIQGADMQKFLQSPLWDSGDGETKRLMMSELLVPESASASFIDTVYVPDESEVAETAKMARGIHVVPFPRFFFGNNRQRQLRGTNITLIHGDMFFSQMQTLTISVNTVGVMGGGLAARARDNFPRLYVEFQKRCRTKELTTRSPYLYKEPYSFDEHLADDPSTLVNKPNNERWFLLFATKQHWRYPSKLEYLCDGLQWLKENAEKKGIKSLAMPALGCGLGDLRWDQVGPLMCQNLRELGIPCEIYLPLEPNKTIPDSQLSEEFLLNGV